MRGPILKRRSTVLTSFAANLKVKYYIQFIIVSQFRYKRLQKKEYQYAKSRGKVRNSAVHERKRTMRGPILKRRSTVLTSFAANLKVKYYIQFIIVSQFRSKRLQKKEYQYAKSRGKVRNSVVHERKRRMRGILSTCLRHTSISPLPLKLKKNTNL